MSSDEKPENSKPDSKSVFNAFVENGINYLYNFDFNEAKSEFDKAINADKESPVGYFYSAMVYWEKILNNPKDKDSFKLFEEWIEKTIVICEKRIKEKGKDDEAVFYLGGSYGFRARVDLIQKKWLKTFWDAKKGRDYIAEASSLNPQNYDAYLGLGMFNYFLDKMPKIVKFFSFLLFFSGDRELGLKQLNKCATEGRFARTEAKFVLLGIYTYLEKNYAKALSFGRELKVAYPRNPRFYYTTAIIYSKMKKYDEASGLADEIDEKIRKKEPNFTASWAPKVNYIRGEIYREKGSYKEALPFYNLAVNSDFVKDTWVPVWSYFRMGTIYDILGQREKAKSFYKKVLELEDISEENTYIHEFAEKYLKRPYSEGDSEVPE